MTRIPSEFDIVDAPELGISFKSVWRSAKSVAKKATPILTATGTVAMVIPGGQAYGAAALGAAAGLEALGASAAAGDKKAGAEVGKLRIAAKTNKKAAADYKLARRGISMFSAVKKSAALRKKLTAKFLAEVKKKKTLKSRPIHPPVLKRSKKAAATVKAMKAKYGTGKAGTEKRMAELHKRAAAGDTKVKNYLTLLHKRQTELTGFLVEPGSRKKPKFGTWKIKRGAPMRYVVTKGGHIVRARFA